MIIAKIKGGLGNQMFQYAFARSLAEKHNVEFKIDNQFFFVKNAATPRTYLLSHFNIIENFAGSHEIEQLKNRIPTLLNKIFRKILPSLCSSYKEDNKAFDIKALKLSSDVYVDGYWQSPRYFSHIDYILKKEFTLKPTVELNENLLSIIQNTNSIGIHFRRGDYVTLGLHKVCNEEYYKKALDIILGKQEKPVIFVFSDDKEWAKANVKYIYETYYVSAADYVELYLMSCCKHNIIANSTFSWWAAWLNKNSDKIVVAPKALHKSKAVPYIYPSSWILT